MINRHCNPRPAFWLALTIFLLALGAIVHRADAADLDVNWTHPTTNEDGSSIPATGPGSLVNSRVEWGTCNGSEFGLKAGEQVVAQPAARHKVTGVGPGTWCARVFAKNTWGAESAASNVAWKTVPAPVPGPPTNVTVAIVNPLVYDTRRLRSGELVAHRVVGWAPIGTACVADGGPIVGPDLYKVRKADVRKFRWWQRSKTLVAQCA